MAYQLTDEDKEIAQQMADRALASQIKQPKPVAKPQERGNLFTNSLSTAGGILGAIGGSFLGPGIGTAAGGAAGAGAGKFLENLLEGNNAGEGVLGEAALGTLGGIGKGFKAIKGAAAAGRTGGNALDILKNGPRPTPSIPTAQTAIKSATPSDTTKPTPMGAEDILSGQPSKFSFGGKLKEMGDKALLSQYGTISKPIARSSNPTQTISQLADMGITKPDDAARIASMFTGSGGLVNKAVLKATGSAGGVDTSTMRRVFDDAIDNYGLVEKDAASVRKVFEAQMKRLSGGAKGSLNPLVSPTDALSVMKAFEKRAANLSGKGDNYRLATPERLDQASVLKLARDELEDALYTGAGANAQIGKVLTPEFRESLLALQPGNKQWAQYVDNNVMGAKTIGDLRSAQRPFVQASKIIDEGDANSLTYGGRVGNAFAGGGGGILSTLGGAATELLKNPAARATGNTLRAIGGAVPSMSSPGANALRQTANVPTGGGVPDWAKITGMQLGGRALTGTLPGQANGTPDAASALSGVNQVAGQEANSSVMGTPGDIAANDILGGKPQSMYSRENAAMDIQNDLQRTGGANMEKYLKLYEFMNPEDKTDKANATTQKALGQSANADATLKQLETMMQQAGGAGGPLGGNVSSFLGGIGFNNNAKTYNDLASGSVTQIAKALGETGAMSDSDRIAYSNLIPKITDTPEVAQAKFAALRERMATAQKSALQFGASDEGIEEALAAAGY